MEFKSQALRVSKPNSLTLKKALKDDLAMLARDCGIADFLKIHDEIMKAGDRFAADRRLKLLQWEIERGWGKAPQTVTLGIDENSAEAILERLAIDAMKIDAVDAEIVDEEDGN